ncbi:MAG: hypothetical protein WAQ53_17375 [Thiofilum sp.]|uniref:hypothetical protein n=1 Tax=Thiofilum sp. TaxID=2212733 RepID=UPI0025F4A47E|nr:hypothetical protein [Thiofilum sp.]MBK8452892.1 hypothetical protein [Thiofilum sp.]
MMISPLSLVSYPMKSRARTLADPSNLASAQNKTLLAHPFARNPLWNNRDTSSLLYNLIKQLLSLSQAYNVPPLAPPTPQKTQLEVLTPEQIAMQGKYAEQPITHEEYQLSQQQILIKFENSSLDQRGLTDDMEAELQKLAQELNVESSFLRDAEDGWKIIQIKGIGQTLDQNTMDKIAQYMANSPKIQYADVIGVSYPNS